MHSALNNTRGSPPASLEKYHSAARSPADGNSRQRALRDKCADGRTDGVQGAREKVGGRGVRRHGAVHMMRLVLRG